VVRKNSIRLPSDRDVGTYLFGFAAPENPRSQPRLWLANCYFSLAAAHITLLCFVLGLARIELVVADFKGIGAG